jgi:hypothetical protein
LIADVRLGRQPVARGKTSTYDVLSEQARELKVQREREERSILTVSEIHSWLLI